MFEARVNQLASGASIKVAELDNRHALIKFSSANSGFVQPLFILPYDDVWEFSVPSAIKFDNISEFPQGLLAALFVSNSKNKRAFWCIEQISGKYLLSAMLNFPSDSLTPSEFSRICNALVSEVDKLESAILKK